MIRVEKDGRPRDIAVSDIYAIRANAHYTYIHDGEKEYFCSLSISALEARLDPKAFLRVHRSYIVSVDRIARVKRSGEAGVAELGLPVRCSIPMPAPTTVRSSSESARSLAEPPQLLKCVIAADAFRAPNRRWRLFQPRFIRH